MANKKTGVNNARTISKKSAKSPTKRKSGDIRPTQPGQRGYNGPFSTPTQ